MKVASYVFFVEKPVSTSVAEDVEGNRLSVIPIHGKFTIEGRKTGDGDGDGVLGIWDALAALRASVGLSVPDFIDVDAFDVDQDGRVASAVARIILQSDVTGTSAG